MLATLFYVAREIRHNTRSTTLAMLQSAADAAVVVFRIPAQDPTLALAIRTAMFDAEKLTEEERARLVWWFLCVVRLAENGFLQHQLGVVDDKTWNARANSFLRLLSFPTFHGIWQARINDQHEDFVTWANENREEPGHSVAPP